MKKIIIKEIPNEKYDDYVLIPATEEDIKKAGTRAEPWRYFDGGDLRADLMLSSSGVGLMVDLGGLLVPDNISEISVFINRGINSVVNLSNNIIRPLRILLASTITNISKSDSTSEQMKLFSSRENWERAEEIRVYISLFGTIATRLYREVPSMLNDSPWDHTRAYEYNKTTHHWCVEGFRP